MLHQHTNLEGMEVTTMPAHHLGERRAITTRVHPELLDALADARAAANVGTMSQFVADLLAERMGRPDLIRELGKEETCLLTA